MDDVPVKDADVASRFGIGDTEVDSLDGAYVLSIGAPVLLAASVYACQSDQESIR